MMGTNGTGILTAQRPSRMKYVLCSRMNSGTYSPNCRAVTEHSRLSDVGSFADQANDSYVQQTSQQQPLQLCERCALDAGVAV